MSFLLHLFRSCFVKHRLTLPFGIAAGAIVVLGVAVAWWQELEAQRLIRETVMSEARMIAAALDTKLIAQLNGDASDLRLPAFQNLQARVRQIQSASSTYRYVYLMGRDEQGVPFFFMGSAPDGTDDYSPPGQPYPENPPSLERAFDAQVEVLSPPVTDRWGQWVSALIPVKDPQTGALLAVFGMDLDAQRLSRYVIQRMLVPVALILLALLALLTTALMYQVQTEQLARRQTQSAFLGLERLNAELAEEIREHNAAELQLQLSYTQISEINAQLEEEISERKLAETAVEETKERLLHAIRVSQTGIFDHDHVADTLYWSPKLREIFGWGPDEPTSLQHFLTLVHPEDLPAVEADVAQAHNPAGDGIWDESYRVLLRDGAVRWVVSRSQTFFGGVDGARYPVRTVGATRDITDDKLAEQELQEAYSKLSEINQQLEEEVAERAGAERALAESEAQYRSLLESANDAILVFRDQHIVECNKQALAYFACEREDLLGHSMLDFLPEFQPAGEASVVAVQRWLAQALEGSPQHFECLHQRLTGETFLAEVSFNSINLAGVNFALGILRDISERRWMEQQLLNEKKFIEALFNSLPGTAYAIDETGHYVRWNCNYNKIMGFTDEEMAAIHVLDPIHPEDREHVTSMMQDANITGKGSSLLRAITKDGRTLPFYCTGVKVDLDGKPLIVGIGMEMAERLAIEDSLRETSEILQRVLDAVPQYICWKDRKSTYMGCNQAFCDLHGLAGPQDIVGKTDWDLRSTREQVEFYLACDQRVMISDQPEYRILETGTDKAGCEVWFETTKIPLHRSNGSVIGILVSIDDITERRQAELALSQSEERYRLLAETAHEMIAIWNLDGRISYANRAALDATGYDTEEIKVLDSISLIPPEELQKWDEISAARSDGDWRNRTFTTQIITKGALRIPVEVSSIPIRQNGKITGVMNVARDISDRLQAERARLQMLQAQKLEAIGTLAGGIAHDFNNILFAIIANAELMQDSFSGDSPDAQCLEQILLASQRAKELVQQILTFSRRSEAQPTPLNISLVAKEVVKLLRPALPSSIEMRIDVSGNASLVLADPTEIHQVLMNLCTNAAHALSGAQGLLEVSIKDVFFDEETVAAYSGLRPGEHVQLTISDNGCGMPPQVRERIFEPFFTTKDPGQGTGMGLSVVHGIITGLGGIVTVYSEVGRGTTFHVYLPAVAVAAPSAVQENDVALPRGTGRILVVDDERAVTDAVARVLQGLGYTVTQCNTSTQALELFQHDPLAFDLVLTDLTMPRMNGPALARALLTQRPELPIILCTGFSQSVSADTAAEIGICSYLAKPISRQALAQTVARLLGFTTAL